MKRSPKIVASPPRRRNAAATRREILDAAARLFAERNYDTVGLREIVAAVGVDVSMVKRYFGSKKGLYAEVIEMANAASGTRQIFEGKQIGRNEVAERLIRFVSDIDSDDQSRQAHLNSLLLLLRAPHSQSTEPMMHKNMEENVLQPLAKWLGGAHAEERAALITSYLLGFGTMQRLIKADAFNNGNMDVVIDYVKSALLTCIDGTLPKPAKNPVKRSVQRTIK